ncbi:MAG: hypothetical protein AABZ11_07250 [Nitrospinota bacterium]
MKEKYGVKKSFYNPPEKAIQKKVLQYTKKRLFLIVTSELTGAAVVSPHPVE